MLVFELLTNVNQFGSTQSRCRMGKRPCAW
jgi:hypothetical protein